MGKIGSENFIRLILAIIFASLLIVGGMKSFKVLEKKTNAQVAVTESINRWKQSYKALQGVIVEWDKTYVKSASVRDIRAIISLIDIRSMGLSADMDNLVLTSASQVKSATNIDIGLSKICLGINSENFIIKASTYPELLKGIENLAHRKDIYLGNVSIQGELASPQAKIGDFCVFLRNE